jgi:hypothetical protein
MRTITLIITFGLLLLVGVAQAKQLSPQNAPIDIVVYRSPSCGCCGKWLEQLKSDQFNVIDNLVEDVQSVKNRYGITAELASCHTALVNGYVIEGHVPVNDIKKLLTSKPPVAGITVPGMPVGTPGMEIGTKKDAYQVISFDKSKHTQVFNQYGAE